MVTVLPCKSLIQSIGLILYRVSFRSATQNKSLFLYQNPCLQTLKCCRLEADLHTKKEVQLTHVKYKI
ncbi:unnamed protein product [Brassica rapa subsp. trilocularis]